MADDELPQGLTWLVQTLLNVTNANVCASIVPGKSFLASPNGMAKTERKSWGANARDSTLDHQPAAGSGWAELRCRTVL